MPRIQTHKTALGDTVLLIGDYVVDGLESLLIYLLCGNEQISASILEKIKIKTQDPIDRHLVFISEKGKILCVLGSDFRFFDNKQEMEKFFGFFNCQGCAQFKKEKDPFFDIVSRQNYCVSCCSKFKKCDFCKLPSAILSRENIDNKIQNICQLCRYDIVSCDRCPTYHLNHCPKTNFDQIQSCQISLPIVKTGKTDRIPIYIGMELEISTSDPADVIAGFRKKYPGLFWGVRDGSVSGVEMVSQPMSLDYWKTVSIDWRINGGNDHCGIHLHVCRMPHRHAQLFSILKFMDNNREFIYSVAERRSQEYAKIVELSNYMHEENLTNRRDGNKYVALNFSNIKTLEYRIFKSTTDDMRIHKNIEFVSALWDWTNRGGVSETKKEFSAFVKSERDYYPNLNKFLEVI